VRIKADRESGENELTLPNEADKENRSRAKPGFARCSMPKILLVDDDDIFAAMLDKMLARGGYAVVRARNGVEAVALFDSSFDLVLTDLIMPQKEGLELIGELRSAHPDVRIIAMSGGGRHEPDTYLPMAKLLGAAVILRKPFSTDQLLNAIRSISPAND
jgi:CheY-like chemotaxis protein